MIICIGQRREDNGVKILDMNRTFYSEFYSESWHFQEWFKLHGIQCRNIKKWLEQSVVKALDTASTEHSVFFLKPQTILRLSEELATNNNAKDFLKNKTLICGGGWFDSKQPYQNDLLYFFEYRYEQFSNLADVYKAIDYKIIFLTDGIPSSRLKALEIFDFVEFHFEFLFYANTYLYELLKRNSYKDFIYLIMEKGQRSHRDIVYEMLLEQGLHNKSICIKNKRNNRLKFADLINSYSNGIYELEHTWYDRFPSIDYYNQTNFEIVGETFGEMGNDAFFPTEKIVKPITMKHPFVVAGSKHYLKHLKQLGFKTFDSVISEEYDLIDDCNERMKRVVETANGICTMGSGRFYEQTRDICEHNYNHLSNLQGQQKNIIWRNMKLLMEKINEN
jgi:hypothetical protein